MTIEIHRPELENLIQQRMESGAFRSVEDFLMHELINTARDATASAQVQTSLAEKINAIWSDVPPEDWDTMPTDGASEHDHYIYGLPKRNV
jgi:hypothetical protein